jgi:hypothetical protein
VRSCSNRTCERWVRIGKRCRALDGLATRFGVPTGAVIENTVVLERAVTDHIDVDAV